MNRFDGANAEQVSKKIRELREEIELLREELDAAKHSRDVFFDSWKREEQELATLKAQPATERHPTGCRCLSCMAPKPTKRTVTSECWRNEKSAEVEKALNLARNALEKIASNRIGKCDSVTDELFKCEALAMETLTVIDATLDAALKAQPAESAE